MREKLDIKVTVIDYGMGNLRSVWNKVKEEVASPILSSDPQDVMDADALVLPGVGHFQRGMEHLESYGLLDVLQLAVLENGTPILGICLGMQLFSTSSEEGDVQGLGWLEAETVRFDPTQMDNPYFKVPHMGWNSITVEKDVPMLSGVAENGEFYFCHSYFMQCRDEQDIIASTHYGNGFTCAVQKGNIHGVQFHPEKSHDAGALMIRQFLESTVKALA